MNKKNKLPFIFIAIYFVFFIVIFFTMTIKSILELIKVNILFALLPIFSLLMISSVLITVLVISFKKAKKNDKTIESKNIISESDSNEVDTKIINEDNQDDHKRYCKACGNELDENSDYCSLCGRKQ